MKNSLRLFSSILFISSSAFGVSRIENFNVNRKKVSKIYLSYSKASVVRFPDTIEEVRVGLPNFYQADVSKTYARELTLFLKKLTNNPSNLIVRTTSGNIYVFDLVSSKSNHQDVVFVDESFYNKKFQFNPQNIKRVSISEKKRKLIFKNTKRRRIQL